MTEFGVDLSDYDQGRGPVDVASMAHDGIAFLTHKATEGTSTRHRHLAEVLGQARGAGIEFLGAYHVVRSGDITAQVRWYLATLDDAVPWWRTYPGFFHQVDLEVWSYDPVTAFAGIAFAGELQRAQPKTVLTYASRGQYGDRLAALTTPLWNAAYGANPVAHYRAAYPGDDAPGWRPYSGCTPVLLQYGSRLTIGTQPGCDADAFRGTREQLRALIEGEDMDSDLVIGAAWRQHCRTKMLDVMPPGAPILAGEEQLDVQMLKRIDIAVAADATRDAAMLAAIQALAAGGTSIDTQAVLAAINQAAAATSAQVVELHDQLAAARATIEQLRAAAAAEAQAGVAALDPHQG